MVEWPACVCRHGVPGVRTRQVIGGRSVGDRIAERRRRHSESCARGRGGDVAAVRGAAAHRAADAGSDDSAQGSTTSSCSLVTSSTGTVDRVEIDGVHTLRHLAAAR